MSGDLGTDLGILELGTGGTDVLLAPPPPPPPPPLPLLLSARGPSGLYGQYPYHIYVRDNLMQRVAEVDDYSNLSIAAKWNDIGTWTLTLASNSAAIDFLSQDLFGIEVVREDSPLSFAGIVDARSWTFDATTQEVTVSGLDDSCWIQRRLAYPDPAGPPYTPDVFDVRTGAAETVILGYANDNLGPGAQLVRAIPGLIMASDGARGSTVTGRARFDNLLTLLQGLATAGGGLGFRIVPIPGGGLLFEVFETVDRSAYVKFTPTYGNVGSVAYSQQAATENYIIVGGSGGGTSRKLREHGDSDSMTQWGRIEGYLDNPSMTSNSELDQAIDTELANNAQQVSLTAVINGTASLVLGVDYNLGDTVTLLLEGAHGADGSDLQIAEQIQEIDVTLDQDGELVQATMGGPLAQPLTAQTILAGRNFRRPIQDLNTRLNIESEECEVTESFWPFNNFSVFEAQWRKMGRIWAPTGPLLSELNELSTVGDRTGMQVKVASGRAWIRGHYYENDAELPLAISNADPSNPRIDRAVVTLDSVASTITSGILTGVAGVSPTAPVLTQTDSRWDMPLAQIAVAAGAVTINAADVTDQRAVVGPEGNQVKYKLADESVTSSVTLQDDDDLWFYMAPNEVWQVFLMLIMTGGTGTDWSGTLDGPAGATGDQVIDCLQVGAANQNDMKLSQEPLGTATNVGCLGTGTPTGLRLDALVTNGANEGRCRLRWAQNSSSGTTTKVKANSLLRATRIA